MSGKTLPPAPVTEDDFFLIMSMVTQPVYHPRYQQDLPLLQMIDRGLMGVYDPPGLFYITPKGYAHIASLHRASVITFIDRLLTDLPGQFEKHGLIAKN